MGLERKSALTHRLFDWTLKLGWRRFQYQQGRAAWGFSLLVCPLLNRLLASKIVGVLGGRLKFAICGGAALPPDVGRFFISLGVPVFQGYGMTEASPVVSVNRPHDNIPDSIGLPLPGVDVKLSHNDELLTRSPSVMLGYWNNEQATRDCVDEDGWLHTGDQARIDDQGHIFITGRLKDIIVLANGEKVPPADMEMAIGADPLFAQIMVVGEAKPYLVALTVLDPGHWRSLAEELSLDPLSEASLTSKQAVKAVLARIAKQLRKFPGYAQIRRVSLSLQPWTVEAGLLTPTQKIKRAQILIRFAEEVEQMYTGRAL
jgi:long-chain acyl-CoA synthetase